MKIIDLKTRTVAIPLNAQLRHNTGVHPGYFLRTILEVITDEGIVGWGSRRWRPVRSIAEIETPHPGL